MPATTEPPAERERLYDHVKLRAWREEAGLRRTQVAADLAITEQWLADLETATNPKRQPSLDLLARLARYYGRGLAELLTEAAA